ncbi:hypothetical protein [Microbacterium sp. ZW T5_56]|uniref:hypothetical protein n=1 Tax=Microbacterium sp. ZW T5_56 TaxID=3378081 RepID=UPI003854FFB8
MSWYVSASTVSETNHQAAADLDIGADADADADAGPGADADADAGCRCRVPVSGVRGGRVVSITAVPSQVFDI